MLAARSLALLLAASLALAAAAPPPLRHVRARRQLADDNSLQPLEGAEGDEQNREKRKLEGVTQAKFGIKNAVLGFVFGKINSLIDAKTRFVDTLDRQNIEINKQYGIEAPQGGGLASLSGIVGQVIGPKLQLLGPKIQAVTGLLGGASGGGSSGGQEWHYVGRPGEGQELGHFQQHEQPHQHHQPPQQHEHVALAPLVVAEPEPETGHHQHHGYRAQGRYPRVRPEQGQPGLPGEPVWAFRIVADPHH